MDGCSEPWRGNLIRFSQDIKAAGLERFTIHFSPQWANDPIGLYGPNGRIQDVWDPAKLEENWGLIRNARTLVKQYGPAPTTLFDIFSEGAMSPFAEDIPRVQAYTAELWRRYASAFGVEDVTISVIGKGRADEASDRVRNLVTAIRSTGLSLPRWFEIHPDFDGPPVFAELNAFDATLRELGLDQPLVLGEMSYENASVAAAVAEFVRTSQRHVIEVYEWPQTVEGGPCPPPPYRADAYRAALTGQAPKPATPLTLAPIPSLRASVATAGQVTLTTSERNHCQDARCWSLPDSRRRSQHEGGLPSQRPESQPFDRAPLRRQADVGARHRPSSPVRECLPVRSRSRTHWGEAPLRPLTAVTPRPGVHSDSRVCRSVP